MPPTVTLSGFQILQLLAVADHSASAVVVVTQDGGHTHARLLDRDASTAVYLPITGREAADLAQRKIDEEAERMAFSLRGLGLM